MLIRSRVFRKYILSYLAVVLAICMVLGLALVRVSTDQLRQAEMEVYQTRLAQTGDYVERQLSAMEDIRLSIKTQLVFQPFYLKQQKTNEVELLNAFSRYSSFSPWIEEYYLWYQDDEKVFGTRSAYSERIFFQEIMNGMAAQQMEERLSEQGGVFFSVEETRPDSLMIAMPFYFGTSKTTTGRCTLFFFVNLNHLQRTIWQMTGLPDDSEFSIEYDGLPMLSTLTAHQVVGARSMQEKVEVFIAEPSIASLERLANFNRLMVWIALLVGLLGTVIAIYAAWRSYQPIRRLFAKYAGSQKPSNELQTLEEMLNSSLRQKAFSEKQIEEQMGQLNQQQRWLKQQLVMMLISGSNSPVVKEMIQKMGFEMVHERFALCVMYLQEDEQSNEQSDDLVRSIEDFSDEEYTLYVAELHKKAEYFVLMNFDEEEQIREIMKLVTDSIESRGLSVHVQISRSCNRLEDIASVAIEELNHPPVTLSVDHEEIEEEDALEQLSELVESGCTSQALALLETMITKAENRYPSYLMHIYMLNRLAQQVMTMASRKGLILPKEPLAQNPDSIRDSLTKMVQDLCRKAEMQRPDKSQVGGETAAYVREHCLDADISLSSTAEALGISTKQVSRLLRMEIGMTFKEYLLQLRMTSAQGLLRDQGLSISETANRVGYFNISHFIKCFKAYTGMTPGEWKKLMSNDHGCSDYVDV